MRLNKTLSVLTCSAMLLVSCKTSHIPIKSNPITYTINNTIAEDTSLVNYYTPFKLKMESEMNRVIGTSAQYLTKVRSQPEFLVGNFFADALLEIGRKIDPEVSIAVATKDGIRTEVKEGAVTVGSMFELMPFENMITVLELTGNDIFELCQFIAKTGGQPIAGFTMKIKDDEPVDILIGGIPLDRNQKYKLVTYDYLANGGDHIKGILNPLQRTNTTSRVREQLIEYVEGLTKRGQKVNTQLDGRITLIK